MGLFDKLKGELIDIIEWLEDDAESLAYRFERYGNEIKNGAQLTVREGQVAILVNEGEPADVFEPGMYTLETANLPILSTLKGWKYGFESPSRRRLSLSRRESSRGLAGEHQVHSICRTHEPARMLK
jgi:membrane protease subunit (stomatin/prohibitin family)